MKINWNYLWRTSGFHLVWWIVSPIAGLFSFSRSPAQAMKASERMDLVYESMKKYVIRPLLDAPLRGISDADLETLLWLAEAYPVSLREVAEIWEKNDRLLGKTVGYLKLKYKSQSHANTVK